MKKKMMISLLILFLTVSATAVASDVLKYKGMPVRELVWNGKPVQSKDIPVVVMDGRTMIPAYLLKSVGYSVASSGNKVVVVTDGDRKYLNNIGILHSFNKFLNGLRELNEDLLLKTVEQQSDEKIARESIESIKDRMNALQQEYSEKAKLLDSLTTIIDFPSAIPNESAKMMTLYQQTVKSWAKYAASGSDEDLNAFLSLIKEAQQLLKSTQQAVEDYANKNFTKL